jgi:hypothetical protein
MKVSPETLQLASDPNTSAEVLLQLYTRSDAVLNKALALNPNTPKEILISLAAKHPLELVKNPSFELFFMEDPAFFKKLPYEASQAMIEQSSSMPNWLIEIMIQGYASRLARQPSTPAWALDYISRAKPPEIRSALASNRNLPEELFWYLSEDPVEEIRHLIALNPSAPEELLWHLAENEKTSLRLVLCENTALSEELFWFFAESPHVRLRRKLALNPKAPEGVLEYLSRDEDLDVLSNVARNQASALTLLLRLAVHPSLQVRLNVCRNTQIRNNLPELISQQPTPGQLSLFSLPTPINQLIALLIEPSSAQLAYWEALLYDGTSTYSAVSVAKWAVSSLVIIRQIIAGAARDEKELRALCDDPAREVREALLFNRYTPSEALSRLLQTKTLPERISLAMRPTLPENLLLALGQDEQEEVRAAVTARGFLPQTVVEVLCKDPSLAVQQRAALHSHWQPPSPEEVRTEEQAHAGEEPLSLGWGDPEGFISPPEPDEAQWEDREEDLGELIEEIRHSEIDLDSFDHYFEDEE